MTVRFAAGKLDLAGVRRILAGDRRLRLVGPWRRAVDRAAAMVARAAASSDTIYGLNTGFGLLAQTNIPLERLRELQLRLVRSHQSGIGPDLDGACVALTMALKVNSLARGHSGVRRQLIELLVAMIDRAVLPCMPVQGSVGASGDLAPLAHMSAVLIGEGHATFEGRRRPGAKALAAAGLAPLELAPKEGLALLNGTQVSTALALAALIRAEDIFQAATVAGAMSVDAMLGSDTPFDAELNALRGHRGQIDAAAAYRALLHGSAIRRSHLDCDRVQDPYSLRCQPQVMGACLDQLRFVARTLITEANAVTDNPLVFADRNVLLSGGNFHAEPVAMAADAMAVALAEIGALSERRMALLIDPHLSGLPAFLVAEPGIDSGFMIAQVTAAALASENKSLAHPASVDSLPTSANQEDHVSMAAFAARRLMPMADNVESIIAIELLAAAQGIDFRRPLKSSVPIRRAHATIRRVVRRLDHDRPLTPDIEAVDRLIRARAFARLPGVLCSTPMKRANPV